MVRKFLEYWQVNGCISWDVFISKTLSVIIVSALGCRPGYVARSRGYTDAEYMKCQDIELAFEGDVKHENLRATITLRYTKRNKAVMGKEFIRYFRPLNEPAMQHVCPLALLLVHTLIHGLVYGSSMKQVLDTAEQTPGRFIMWKQLEWPVIPALTRVGAFRCELDKPTLPKQLLKSIKLMGVVANIIGRV